MAKKQDTRTYVQERLRNLVTLKDTHLLQKKAEIWRDKANMKEWTNPTKNEFRTQISSTVKMQKDADLLSAQPEWSFIPLDAKWRINRRIVKHVWDYHRLISNTDEAISDVIQSATTYWSGIIFDWIKHIWQNVQAPRYTTDEDWEITWIEFKEEKVLKYSGIWSERIPFQNFFINWSNIKESTEAVVIRYFDKTEYINEKLEDSSFNSEAIKKLKKTTGHNQAMVDWTVGDNFDETSINNTIFELEYWNAAKDEYIIEANGIEVKNSPLPYPHKMLPFSIYLDNKADDRIWGIGEYELLEQEERYKNELRTLLVRWVKSSIGFLLKDRNSEIEEDELNFGIGEVYETDDVNAIKHFVQNTPVGAISDAETKVDNDIIAKSGIDYKSQFLSPWETATKTAGKDKSAKKRINKNIKDNAFSFYRRLAEIRMANIQFLHSVWNKEIPIEGGSINSKWVFKADWGWYGSAYITKELLKWDIKVLPIVETMLWFSKERKRESAIRYAQLVGNMAEADGTRPVKATQLAKLITDEFNYDFSKLTEQTNTGKTAKNILDDFKKKSAWTKWTPLDPDFVPWAQRSGADKWVPTLSWVSNNNIPLED